MKMKLLDYTLIGLLAGGLAAPGLAQVAPSTATAPDTRCDSDGCEADGEMLYRLRGQGEPAAATDALRVVDRWSLDVPGGGLIWATEDPNLGQPQLNLSAPSQVAFENGRIVQPVQFHAYSNYPAFIERAEVLVFRASDTDLVTPLATLPLPVGAVTQAQWDGALPQDLQARPGDELLYLVRAHSADGSMDETYPRRLQLVTPEEFERGRQVLRQSVERSSGLALGADEAQQRSLEQGLFGENSLRQQNIAIHGSRIRIQGRDLAEGYGVRINGQSQPVDLERKLVAEYLVPVGRHGFDIELSGPGLQPVSQRLDLDVSGKYLFAVAIADLTASGGRVTGSIEPLAGDERYDDSFLVEGRLAFYLKGKVKGKYLVTAQADTQEREVSELFSGFLDADPQDVFRRLDPDAYYPVYGDDSIAYRDADTQGRFYVRVDWDKNQALWGNFATGLTGTEYAQYGRSLYGAAVDWRSRDATGLGEARSQLRVFGSQAQSAPGHSEFLGTGGSLYYLKHTDVLPGSDRVVLEIRDGTTGRVERRVELARGADYEIDAFQGRVLLTRPLSQITRDNLPTITRDTPLDGFAQVLLVDYEFVPDGFDDDGLAAGFRGRHWFGEHVAVGATWVDENRAGDDYALKGLDLTLQAGRGTYLKVEHSRTEATSAPIFFSDNGGLSFTPVNAGLGRRSGDARAVEARANFRELGWTELDWSADAWWRDVDAGFSIGRFDTNAAIREYGIQVQGQWSPSVDVTGRYSRAERGAESLTQSQIGAEWRLGDSRRLAAELRRVDEQRLSGDAAGTLAALQYTHRIGSSLDLYGTAQATLDDDGGAYADNDALTLGAKYLFGDLSSVGAEATTGDRGDSVQVNGEYRLGPEHTIYAGYTHATDGTGQDPLFSTRQTPGWTLGQRWRLSSRANIFNESQFLKTPEESGLAHTFGMDFYPGVGWTLGFTLQDATLERALGNVDRQAVSVSGGRSSNQTQWQSKFEWRQDTGAEQREQWVSTHHASHKLSESLRVAGRVNYSRTRDELVAAAGAEFAEANLGLAWRPVDSTRWAVLAKYTYLYDVSSLPQVGDGVAFYDQRSQVLSLEGIHTPGPRWEFAAKLMRREGEVRFGRLAGQWAGSDATFAAGQVRYGFAEKWHALGEFRWLDVADGGRRQGALLGIDRDLGNHLRAGVGYNFTSFSDDLTDFDYDHRGWFFNLVGWY